MAAHDHHVITAALLTLGSVTVTLDGTTMQWNHSVDLVDSTVWGDTFKQKLISLQDYGGSFEANNDLTDNELDEDLDAAMATNVAVAWRPSSGAIAVTNPELQFTGAMSNLQKTLTHGQVYKVSANVQLTTSAGITRDVTP